MRAISEDGTDDERRAQTRRWIVSGFDSEAIRERRDGEIHHERHVPPEHVYGALSYLTDLVADLIIRMENAERRQILDDTDSSKES
jgi:hypothetical protein